MIGLIGYGNPGRGDDGLGPALAARMADVAPLVVSDAYQLTIDHALAIASLQMVVFADALLRSDDPFEFAPAAPAKSHTVTSHSLSPEAVLALCETLYGRAPEAFVLGISGYDFAEVHEGLSPRAEGNLGLAEAFLRNWLHQGNRLGLTEGAARA